MLTKKNEYISYVININSYEIIIFIKAIQNNINYIIFIELIQSKLLIISFIITNANLLLFVSFINKYFKYNHLFL